ncbi:MAG: helix-turn-helix transcriptional regulator [Syntrophobacteraceae bacterium]|nr:helix-turn-helix transcriptional regulator [Syntrophobacteraceae bacterium]
MKPICLTRLDRNFVSLPGETTAGIGEIRSYLVKIVSPTPLRLSNLGLSSSEVRVAEMVKQGKSNKEIAILLSISAGTVRTRRDNIREKLGLRNQRTNLKACPQSVR